MYKRILTAIVLGLGVVLTGCEHPDPAPVESQFLPPATYEGATLEDWAGRVGPATDQASLRTIAPAILYFGGDSLPYLADWMTSGSANQKLFAADLAAQMGPAAAPVAMYASHLLQDALPELRVAGARMLSMVGPTNDPLNLESVLHLMNDPHWAVRYHAAKALGAMGGGGSEGHKLLVDAARLDLDDRVRHAAVGVLGGRPILPRER